MRRAVPHIIGFVVAVALFAWLQYSGVSPRIADGAFTGTVTALSLLAGFLATTNTMMSNSSNAGLGKFLRQAGLLTKARTQLGDALVLVFLTLPSTLTYVALQPGAPTGAAFVLTIPWRIFLSVLVGLAVATFVAAFRIMRLHVQISVSGDRFLNRLDDAQAEREDPDTGPPPPPAPPPPRQKTPSPPPPPTGTTAATVGAA